MIDLKQLRENEAIDRQAAGKFDSMAEVLPEGQQGVAQIDHFTMDPLDTLASISRFAEDYVPNGRYARLKVNGQLMMSDTPMEKRTNLEVIEKARGRVLIAGLGLGMILRAIIRKPEVTHITVLEKYRDVIDLVFPSLLEILARWEGDPPPRLEVLCADVFQWEPPVNTPKYHVIYFDIWPDSLVKYLPEMHYLHRRYRPLLAKGGWMRSWTYEKLLEKQRGDKVFTKQLPAVLEKHAKDHTPEEFAVRLRLLLAAAEDDDRMLSDGDKQIVRQFAAAKGIEL